MARRRNPDIPNLTAAQRTKVIVFSVAYIAIFGLVLALAGIMATCQTPFCNLCHEMNQDYAAWESSTHASINCLSCHVEPGWINLFKDKMKSAKSLYYHFFPFYEKPINGKSDLSEEEMTDENCMHCHSLEKVTPSEGIIINHEAHEKRKIGCPYCHNRTAHPAMADYEDRMKMDACMTECHNGKKIKNECSLCHTPEFELRPADHLNADRWRSDHGDKAKNKEEKAKCMICHADEKFCTSCHAITMPHPVNWDRNHKNWNREFGKCVNCHTEGNVFCENCHHPGYDPRIVTWRRAHPNVVKQQGQTGCGKCHKISYCNSCHRRQ